jgi:hypothetical protein
VTVYNEWLLVIGFSVSVLVNMYRVPNEGCVFCTAAEGSCTNEARKNQKKEKVMKRNAHSARNRKEVKKCGKDRFDVNCAEETWRT